MTYSVIPNQEHNQLLIRNRKRAGFTLAELLIVLMIILVLASVAISFYQTYTIRSQVDEGLTLANKSRALVEEAYRAHQEAPADRLDTVIVEADTDSYGDYVLSVEIVNGRIDTTFSNLANTIISNTTLSLTPYEATDGSVIWRCGQNDVPRVEGLALETLGSSEGGLAASYIASSVPSRYLPKSCL